MNIYIPKHIREIGVVDTMCDLIGDYADPEKGYSLDPTTAFNNYYYYLNTDPVNRFLHFVYPRKIGMKRIEIIIQLFRIFLDCSIV